MRVSTKLVTLGAGIVYLILERVRFSVNTSTRKVSREAAFYFFEQKPESLAPRSKSNLSQLTIEELLPAKAEHCNIIAMSLQYSVFAVLKKILVKTERIKKIF